jgi:transcriptional regulator with XRE-family HTH domain
MGGKRQKEPERNPHKHRVGLVISRRVCKFLFMTDEDVKTTNMPHATDLHVGDVVRKRRKELKFSQAELAKAVGLTFQQIQKYERGSNRISASKLYEIAHFLNIPIAYFFDGLSSDEEIRAPFKEGNTDAFLASIEGQSLANAFVKLTPAKRKGVMSLVRAILADERSPS